ncbi:MAG: Tetratricopeptide repeat-containing protein [Candidatus Kentron sp. G]|nr:MAG: Tetratricopeptide repeat-containing protein [Candidatus Kentron sp. G]VFM96846.1 MAG: Tetratricopeptide repeat-containing protein [Candidatus Kentron sp. G]
MKPTIMTGLLLFIVFILPGCQEPPGEGQTGDHATDNALGDHASGTPGPRVLVQPVPSPPDAEAMKAETIRANNRAVGLMGRFEYAAAFDIFSALVKEYPHWLDVKVNLAIATLNRQQDGDEAAALALADEVLAIDPGQLRAHYVAGLLRLYLSSPEQAIGHFAKVAEQDPDDAYAAYYLGQCLAQQSEPEKALDAYRRALALDPYLRSAAYGAFQALQRLRRRDEAREFIEQYQRLATNPRARLAEFKYTRMGPKAEALAVGAPAQSPAAEQALPRPEGSIFAGKEPLPVQLPAQGGKEPETLFLPLENNGTHPACMTVMDIESDGWPDLFVAGAGANTGEGKRPNLLLKGFADGRFVPQEDHPLNRVSHVNAVLWGDFDNDSHLDAYLCRQGPNQLWRNDGDGSWIDVTATTETGNGSLNTVDGAFFDADHDGDLDLFLVNEAAPNGLLYNNRDGTFRLGDMGWQNQNRTPSSLGSLAVILADLDRDRDTDIIVLNRGPPHGVYINDRLWAYHSSGNFTAFQDTPALSATVGDVDSDGFPEIYTLTPEGESIRWSRDDRGDFTPAPLACGPGGDTVSSCLVTDDGDDEKPMANKVAVGSPPWAQMALFDADGDGVLELSIATPAGWSVLRIPEPTGQGDPAAEPILAKPIFTAVASQDRPLLGITPLLLDPGKGFGMVGLSGGDGALVHWQAGPGRHPFLALTFSGMEEVAKSMRSNASGIGTRMAVRAGTRWTIVERFREHSGPGQGLQPVPVGLGGARRLDFVAIDWSDGVFQSEIDLDAGRTHRITETQRQLSSCPVLFAWDGDKYAFITDFLGVGALGYATGPGTYAPPRPWENILLPPNVQPKQGHYSIKLTEPMEEIAYMDAVRLVAYDLPPDWRMVLDERMGIKGPEPTGAAVFYRREILPEKAVNERGETVTASVLLEDGRAAPVGELDRRFIGRLAREHILTLTFPGTISGEKARFDSEGKTSEPVLVIDGWVEYPYSQTMFAAWQAGAAWEAPTIEALDSHGEWQTILPRFGYPAGMPRRMSVPLPNLPAGTSVVRIRTNQEIYWDRIAIAFPEPLPDLQKHTLPLKNARLAVVGFPKHSTGPQRRPRFDYGRRRPFWDTRPMAGLYTEPGPAGELLGAVDDALAIFGPGEEIHLAFETPAAPPPTGWRRYLVLETHGWSKDRDLYTKDGETVGPLPETGKPRKRRDELHARYNTRAIFH